MDCSLKVTIHFRNSCFETNSESISPVKSIHSTLQSNSLSTFESKENFSSTTLNFRLLNNVKHSSKCFGPTERRFAGYEEQLDCDIYSINYEKRLQGLINANDTLNPCLSLCSALMNTFTTYKQAIVIFRNITLTILANQMVHFIPFILMLETMMVCQILMAQQLYQNLEIWVNLEHSYVL